MKRFWILDFGFVAARRAVRVRARRAVPLLALALSGCAAVANVPLALLERDIASAAVMAEGYGEKAEADCFRALKEVVKKTSEISRLDADGIIAATYKAWLLAHYRQQARTAVVQRCMPVALGMGAFMLTQ